MRLRAKARASCAPSHPAATAPMPAAMPAHISSPPDLTTSQAAKSGAGENQDRQDQRPHQDDVLAGNDGPPRSRRHVRQLLRRDFRAPEPFACFSADHDVDIRAVKAGAQQSRHRFIHRVAHAKNTRDLANFHSIEYLSRRGHVRSSSRPCNRSIQLISGPARFEGCQFALAEGCFAAICALAQDTIPRVSLAPARRATSRPCINIISVGMLRMP